jgi:hypothetical protein
MAFKTLGQEEVREILSNGEFERLIGGVEYQELECKTTPYRLQEVWQQRELAKDISSFANAIGGLLLLGVKTEKSPIHSGDEIKKLHPFREADINFEVYNDVLVRWVYPTLSNIEFKWWPSKKNSQEGIASIRIPPQPTSFQPFLITKTVEEVTNGGKEKNKTKLLETLFGYVERRRDDNVPKSVPKSVVELHARLRDGLNFHSLNNQLEEIREALERMRWEQQAPLSSQPDVIEILSQRIGIVAGELELGPTHPTYILAAIPCHKTRIPSLFSSKDAPVVRLLENPPQIRTSGFDLDVGGRAARIVPGGHRRRSLEVKYKTLNLWEDGTLIFAADALDFVCWRPIQKEGIPYRIQPLALIETALLFCQLSEAVLAEADPKPGDVLFEVQYVLELRNTRIGEVNCGLIPGPVGSDAWRFGDDIHRATKSELRANALWSSKSINPGRIAYLLAGVLYEQFGLDHDAIPYRERAGDEFIISTEEIRRLNAW